MNARRRLAGAVALAVLMTPLACGEDEEPRRESGNSTGTNSVETGGPSTSGTREPDGGKRKADQVRPKAEGRTESGRKRSQKRRRAREGDPDLPPSAPAAPKPRSRAPMGDRPRRQSTPEPAPEPDEGDGDVRG